MDIFSVMPNNRIFNSKFIHNIKHDKLELSNRIFTKKDINIITKEKVNYINYDINFYLEDENNILERNTFFFVILEGFFTKSKVI